LAANRLITRLATSLLTIALLVGALFSASAAPVQAVGELTTTSSTGPNHTCAVNADGTLWCWGYAGSNYMRGYLGDGTTLGSTVPVQIGGDADWASVSAGDTHSCAVKNDGRLFCWGSNFNGQLGTGVRDDVFGLGENSPVQVGSDADWSAVSTGVGHTCAIKANGDVYCWGYNGSAATGTNPDVRYVLAPALVGSDYVQVTAGANHSCAITTAKSIMCWGYNPYGAIGDGTRNNTRATPVAVGDNTDWIQVSAGWYTTCALKESGTIYCWGLNSYGEIGSLIGLGLWGPGINAPAQVGADSDWTAVSAGMSQSCAIKSTGSLYCWGQNRRGELGGSSGDLDAHPDPVLFTDVPEAIVVAPDPAPVADDPISTLFNIGTARAAQVRAQAVGWGEISLTAHACATTSDNRLYCWGENDGGALGIGSFVSSGSPRQVVLSAPAAPQALAHAEVSGTGIVGERFEATVGSWTGAPAPALATQWYRCTRPGAAEVSAPRDCRVITGATALTYLSSGADAGRYLRLGVSAVNGSGRTTSVSAAVGVFSPLITTRAHTIAGTARIGSTLTVRSGTLSGSKPVAYAYQWYTCTRSTTVANVLPEACTAIAGANSSQLRVVREYRFTYLVVRVTATNPVSSLILYSASSSVVR
jgi:alpha-tubulin suppressor-like RCC1 family protein